MALSGIRGSKLEAKENKQELSEGLPLQMLMPEVLLYLIGKYLSGDIQISASSYTNGKRLTFFNQDLSAYQQAMQIARDHVLPAGPLTPLETKVRENPYVLLPTISIEGMKGTLLQLAILGLDQTIGVDEGMAERLWTLQTTLLPDTKLQALEQAKCASFFEEKDAKRAIEHEKLLNEAFHRIKKNESGVDRMIKTYIESKKPTVIINNEFALSGLQLLCRACDLLSTKGGELSDWYGTPVRRFCFEVIGGIQREFCFLPRLMQILMSSVYLLIYENKKAERLTDSCVSTFLGGTGSDAVLGVSLFYDDFGAASSPWVSWEMSHGRGVGRALDTYFERLRQHPKFMQRPGTQSKSKCPIM